MGKFIFITTIKVLLLAGYLSSQMVMAVDGDVVYSAPYIMVDPDTGQIVTVNPGPKLKAHEIMPMVSEGNQEASNSLAVPTSTANINMTGMVSQAEGPDTSLPIIILYACLFMIIAGFVIWKRNQSRQAKD
jgi:hypothetical protein